MSKRVSNICDKIWRAIDHSEGNRLDNLNALWACYTREVSLIDCTGCREVAVNTLEASCPDMLKHANADAERRTRTRTSTHALTHTHH
jgi:hypothetical protein